MISFAKSKRSSMPHFSVVLAPKKVLIAGAAIGATVERTFKANFAYGAIFVTNSRGLSIG